jgi:ABC-2 type transport system ATP-binding protein
MDYESSIRIVNVKKKFKSYIDKAGSFKERFLRPNSKNHEDIWVLRGIDLDIKRGEVVGIIGKNGCGKSTLLKLLTKILYPNEGKIETKGRVSSLIELGAGFHPDMSGRENIYTNASIFGIKHKEVDQRLDDIIRFSELEDFIDQPVRTYSSGMYMRLAFAVAINVNADILLIDEILAVGDSAFQKKCFEKLKEIKTNGTTIVIVSHSMDQLYKICDRLIWIENGLIKDEGVPRFIGEAYLAEMEGKRLERIVYENQQIKDELEIQIKDEEAKLENATKKAFNQQNSTNLNNTISQENISLDTEKTNNVIPHNNKTDEMQQNLQIEELKRKSNIILKNESLKSVCIEPNPSARRGGSGECLISHVEVLDEKGKDVRILETGLSYTVKIQLNNVGLLDEVTVVIGFTREDGIYCYGNYVNLNQKTMADKLMGYPISFEFKNLFLHGSYFLDFWVQSLDHKKYDEIISLTVLKVLPIQSKQRGLFSMESVWE